ncbi:MAG: DUF1801 domain-containing protein [Proteobacteria bacterium]|nr:DUF1801 domain-containing protein [Pseudomonadota bacterium]
MAKSPKVDAWFESYDNPQKALMEYVRAIILDADPRIEECLKWKAPTYAYKGNIMSFQPRAKRFLSLMFHRGAHISGEHALLLGDGAHVRTMRFESVAQADAQAEAIAAVFRAWCDDRDA